MATNSVYFLKGTAEKFATLTKSPYTFYLVGNDLYIGEQKLNNQAEITAAVTRIAANEGNITSLQALVNKLDGDATVDGSVKKQIAAAVASLTSAYQAGDQAINDKIGTVPADSTVMAEIAKAQAAATYDDTALAARVQANEDAIGVINGAATVTGSIKQVAAETVTRIVAGASEDFDTLKEMEDWISNHESDATGMNSAIQANTGDIATLKTAVGTAASGSGPDAVAATGLYKKIDDDVAAERTRATGVESGFDTRITTLEGQVGSAVEDQIDAKIAELDSSATAASGSVLSGITIVDGKITSKTEVALANVATSGQASDVAYTPAGDGAAATTVDAQLKADAVAISAAQSTASQAVSDAAAAQTQANKGVNDAAAAKTAADNAQGDVDALENLVGAIPATATATTVVGYVDEKCAALDTALTWNEF